MPSKSKLTRRAFVKFLTSAAGAMGLAVACKPASAPTPVAQPTSVGGAVTVAPTKGITTVEFWPKTGATPEAVQVWRDVVANIVKQRPHLKVNFTPGGSFDAAGEQKLITALAAGTGPDVWGHGGSAGGYWGSKGVSTPLDDYMVKSPLANDYSPAALMPHTWNGKLNALPWGVTTHMLWWRRDFCKEVGLDPNKGPADWTELAEMGQKLALWKGDDIERAGFQVRFEWPVFYFGMFMFNLGGTWFTDDYKRTRINEAEGVQALEFLVDLLHKYKVNAPYQIVAQTPGVPLMISGQVAMDWPDMSAYFFAQASRPDMLPQLGYALPWKGPKSQGTMIFVENFLMSTASKVKDAAWEFLEEISSYENLDLLCHKSGWGALIPRLSWFDKFAEEVKKDPVIQMALEAMKIAYPIHWGPNWTPVRLTLTTFLQEAMLRKRTPKEALDACADKLNKEVLTGA